MMKGWDDFEEDDADLIDDTPITFGKYKGQSPARIAEHDPEYVVWAYENTQGFCSKELYLECSEQSDNDRDDYDSYNELDFDR